jgi:hypothetical protein
LSELRELRQLRQGNDNLKRLVADLSLDRHTVQEIVKITSFLLSALGVMNGSALAPPSWPRV